MNYYDDFEVNTFENFLEKDKSRAKRRNKDYSKAMRKYNICKKHYGFLWYGTDIHRYSKNKIHCSCCMCSFRNKVHPNTKTMSDLRKLENVEQQMVEFQSV